MSQPFIERLNPNDVLLGRGQHIKHEGNSKFRRIVRERVVDYATCRNKSAKDAIAREIVRAVEERGGRFVRKMGDGHEALPTAAAAAASNEVNNNNESVRFTSPSWATAPKWELVDEATVLIKVKQTFRDYSVVARKVAATGKTESLKGSSTMPSEPKAPPSNDSTNAQQEKTIDWQQPLQQPLINIGGNRNFGQQQQPFLQPLGYNDPSRDPLSVSPITDSLDFQLQQLVNSLQEQQRQQQLLSLLSQQYGTESIIPSSRSSVLPFSPMYQAPQMDLQRALIKDQLDRQALQRQLDQMSNAHLQQQIQQLSNDQLRSLLPTSTAGILGQGQSTAASLNNFASPNSDMEILSRLGLTLQPQPSTRGEVNLTNLWSQIENVQSDATASAFNPMQQAQMIAALTRVATTQSHLVASQVDRTDDGTGQPTAGQPKSGNDDSYHSPGEPPPTS